MKLFDDYEPKKSVTNFIFMNGGVGDHVASLVAMDYVIKKYPWIMHLVWVPDFLLDYARHLLPKGTRVGDYTSMRLKYNRNHATKTTQWDGHVSPMKIHPLDYAFLKLADENPSLKFKNSLQIRLDEIDISMFLPKDYVVITTGYTANVREFLAKEINSVARYLLSLHITPVFLGQTNTKTGAKFAIEGSFDEDVDFERGINLIDQTSLLQAAKIMGMAKAVIGVDNGLLHVAASSDVPIIGGFTTVSPAIRMPVRHDQLGWNYYPVIPDEDLECAFCQETTNFLYGHDYRTCMRLKRHCVNQMTALKFIERLKCII